QSVIVVGGGLGGLLVAAEVKRRGGTPLVLEASDEPGGVARTIRQDGFLLEPAAGSLLLPNPDLTPIFEAAGVPLVAARPEARTRFVFERGNLFEVPESPRFLFTRLVSWPAKLRAAGEPWVKAPPPDGEESLLDFFTRRFGRDVGRLGANLMAHGVFAGDPASLSIQATFPKLAALEAAAGSVVRGGLRRRKERPAGAPRASVHVAPDGMAGLAAQLAAYLGETVRPNSPVKAIRPEAGGSWQVVWAGGTETAETVVVALTPAEAAPLVPEPLSSLLSDRPAAPVAVVGLGGPTDSFRLPTGFGALAGPDSGIRALGILFESQYAPGRAPDGFQLAKGIYGGTADPDIMTRSDEELAALMEAELGRVTGKAVDPTWVVVRRSSIPQYPIGHTNWLDQVDKHLAHLPGLHLAGWGYRGIGVSSLGADAARLGALLDRPNAS
ncbi:MAG: protoporphyrinogen oxidase, partial [Acidimicrobiia bacterium]|nr:protoporphyrinogen oxidase [Acidimicrobiia bacterium]